jgi:hypothetical protein
MRFYSCSSERAEGHACSPRIAATMLVVFHAIISSTTPETATGVRCAPHGRMPSRGLPQVVAMSISAWIHYIPARMTTHPTGRIWSASSLRSLRLPTVVRGSTTGLLDGAL